MFFELVGPHLFVIAAYLEELGHSVEKARFMKRRVYETMWRTSVISTA